MTVRAGRRRRSEKPTDRNPKAAGGYFAKADRSGNEEMNK